MSVPIEKKAVESDTPANSLENKSPHGQGRRGGRSRNFSIEHLSLM
jgi:hypothetical protein